MKRVFIWLFKAFISGILTIAILSAICMFYYNVPIHSTSVDGVTDYVWESNKFYSRGTEGFAYGKTNNEGYVNSYDYYEGMDIDVLIMGSSHMEAYNVAIQENTASQLSTLMSDGLVYNIGVSQHGIFTCYNNLDKALEKYKPDYVVVETATAWLDEYNLELVLNGNYRELSSSNSGILGFLQKFPLLRLLYSQFSHWSAANDDSENNYYEDNHSKEYGHLYTQFMNNFSQIAQKHGAKLIIVYQSNIKIDPLTGLAVKTYVEDIQKFSEYCKDSGIEFIDMTDVFISEYNEYHILPHGFINTSVGQGHLNKHGHRMIAEELYKLIGGNV